MSLALSVFNSFLTNQFLLLTLALFTDARELQALDNLYFKLSNICSMAKLARSRNRQNQALLQAPDLEPGQRVARVVLARGENIYEVEQADGERLLFQLPKRLRYVTFIKRGSYVFVRDDETRGHGKVRGDIEAVVLDMFLNDLKKRPFWPAEFTERKDAHLNVNAESSTAKSVNGQKHEDDNGSGEEEDETNDVDDDWVIGGGNPNRGNWDHVMDDDSSDEE